MTNKIAIAVVVAVVGFFVLDAAWFHLGAGLFVARKGAEFIEHLAFWR